jgi:hypothetical protein
VITYEEMAAEAEREVEMRKTVYGRTRYPGEQKNVTPLQRRRIAIMEAIAKHFRDLAQSEKLL